MKRSKVRYDLILLLLAIVASVAVIRGNMSRYDSLERLEKRLATEISRESERNKILISRLKALETDGHIGLLARRRLGYVREDESAYKVILKDRQ
ncbi:MAG: septum formation initiator family protein [Candidatus ainarchaeum sp.]|nr:septum formation initiator family protein [Candidatus ainarchaeum sp.]